MIYLDNSATTRVLPQAADAAYAAMTETFYNPSAAYGPAVAAERTVNACRARLADALGHGPEELYYTSGGTESNNMAIFGAIAPVRGKKRVITCRTEHSSVYQVYQALEVREDVEVVYIGVDETGAASIAELSSVLTPDTALVSLMHVNNETGAITDIAGAGARIRRAAPKAIFHVDGVQAFCKLPFQSVPCDMYAISGHKFHAPKGVGALYVKKGLRFGGGLIGGGQERGMRSGTTNLPGIVGMDAALAQYRQNHAQWMSNMRRCKERLAENLLTIQDTFVNGPSVARGAGHILNVSFVGVRGETLLNALSERQIFVAMGSACSTHKKGKNRVLAATGITGERQEGAIRFSFCPFNTLEEMDIAAQHIEELVSFLRRYRRR